jgi:hypothetical protein
MRSQSGNEECAYDTSAVSVIPAPLQSFFLSRLLALPQGFFTLQYLCYAVTTFELAVAAHPPFDSSIDNLRHHRPFSTALCARLGCWPLPQALPSILISTRQCLSHLHARTSFNYDVILDCHFLDIKYSRANYFNSSTHLQERRRALSPCTWRS